MFGVCALGVSSLYLVPSVTGVSSPQARQPLESDPAPGGTAGRGVRTVAQPVDADTTSAPPTRRTHPNRSTSDPTAAVDQRSARRQPVPTATARDPRPAGEDGEAPRQVERITAAKSTHDRLDLEWAAASDNIAVVGYAISLNGYPIAATTSTHARLRWFNDDSTRQLVQVTAIDAAGNESETAAVVVSRPLDVPSPAPSVEPSTPAPEPAPNDTAPDPPPAEAAPQADASASTDPPSKDQT